MADLAGIPTKTPAEGGIGQEIVEAVESTKEASQEEKATQKETTEVTEPTVAAPVKRDGLDWKTSIL